MTARPLRNRHHRACAGGVSRKKGPARGPFFRGCPRGSYVLERRRVVPVARRRAVVRPPFAAALRDGALRALLLLRRPVELFLRPVLLLLRRAVVRPPFAAALRDGALRALLLLRRPVELFLRPVLLLFRRPVEPLRRPVEVFF